jgi:hypothetical protein
MNNWPTIKDVVYGNGQDLSGWLLDLDLATPDGVNLFNHENQAFFGSVLWSVFAKANAGMYVTFFISGFPSHALANDRCGLDASKIDVEL